MTTTRRLMLLGSAAAVAWPGRHGAAQGTQQGTQDHAHPVPAAPASRQPAPRDAYVYIGWPQDKQTVVGTRFKVWFGTRNFGVAPAGVTKVNTGHHHLIIDAPLPPPTEPIPNDRNHLHFGLGQTETMLELPPGKHTLQLVMGDAHHHRGPRCTRACRDGRGAAVARLPSTHSRLRATRKPFAW
jgi:hypothetical protein